MLKAVARTIVAAALVLSTAACGYDTTATFNADGSVTIALKFLFPKSVVSGTNGASVSGLSPADIAAAQAKMQSKYPGIKVVAVTEGDESGALITIPFKTEKDAFGFLTSPTALTPPTTSSGGSAGINLSNTGGLFTSATHTTSGGTDTYTFKTAAQAVTSPSPGSQQVITDDEFESIFTITFGITVPHVITSAPGALFTLDRKTAIWKLHWTHAETLTATTGQDVGLVSSLSPAQQDPRLVAAVGFIAISVGFLLGMFLTWRGLLSRRPVAAQQVPVPAAVAPAPFAPPAFEPTAYAPPPPGEFPGPPPGAPPPPSS
jgi:hypothetical protein